MSTTASIRNSEWDVVRVAYKGGGFVQYIYRRAQGGKWHAWLVAAPSAVLEKAGAKGLGLYAAASMPTDTILGRYEGTVVAHYATRAEALHSPEAARLVRRGADKILAVRCRDGGPGWDVLDGTTSAHTPPCIPLVNDPRATRLRTNCVLSEHGYLRSTRRVPGFDLDASIAANTNAEFRTDYGSAFWELVDAVGTMAAPIVCDGH